MSALHGRRRLTQVLAVVLAVSGASIGLASPAIADQTIMTSGPLSEITTSKSLNCSVDEVGDSSGEWYGDTACGTFLALGSFAYGPTEVPAGNTYMGWKFVSQSSVSGSGTTASPFTVTTKVAAGSSGITLAQTDSYVSGSQSYRTDMVLANSSSTARTAILYRAGDCYFSDSDSGFGRIESGGVPDCVAPSLDDPSTPGSRIESMIPITGGSSYMEGQYHTVWDRISSRKSLPNTCECDPSTGSYDNGLGLSWPVSLAGGASTTVSQTTYFSPPPLRVTVAADDDAVVPGASDGFTVTVANPTASTVNVDSVQDVLPAGYSYTAGSTSGDIGVDPTQNGQTLTWSGPFTLPPQTDLEFHFGVITSSSETDDPDEATAVVTNPSDQTTAPGSAVINVHPVRVTSISPNAVAIGTTGVFDVTGTTFDPDGTLTVSGTGIDLGNVAVQSSTDIRATYSVAATAPTGKRNITFTDADGHTDTCVGCLSVDKPPTITATNPATLGQGALSKTVVITGARFRPDAQVTFGQLSVDAETVVSSTEIDLVVSVPSTAGAKQKLTVSNGDGGAAQRSVTINPRPKPTSANPVAPHGATTTVTVNGTNFVDGLVVSSSSSGISFGPPSAVTPTSLTVAVTVASGRTAGTFDVTLTNPDGGRSSARVLQVS